MSNVESLARQIEINSGHIDPNVLDFNKVLINCEEVDDIIREVLDQRPTITPLHFGLLIQASAQYVFLKNGGREWFDVSREDLSWDWLLPEIFSKYRKDIVEVCVKKSISLTKTERYKVLQMFVNLFYGDRNNQITILDVGCGFIPQGIGSIILDNKNRPLEVIGKGEYEDRARRSLSSPLPKSKIVCVDIQPPDPTWAAACCWVPIGELEQLETSLKSEMNRVLNLSPVEFHLFDITSGNLRPLSMFRGAVDVVMMSNILYQLTSDGQKVALDNIEKLLKEGGCMFSLEYLPGGSRRRPFTFGGLVYQKFEGQKFGAPLEVFRLDSADCKQVMIGKDFSLIGR